MKKNFKKTILIAMLASTGAVLCTAAMAQAHCGKGQDDSTCGSRALTGRGIVPLRNQERETPVVNNTTVNQITQVVQPNTYQTASSGYGYHNSSAYASCGGAKVLSGGVACDAGGQTTSVTYTRPEGNGWYGSCLTESGFVTTTAYAVCSN